jgi:hypothetical protein
MLITEPAIGYGGGVALMFLHDTFESSLKRKSPPNITGVALAATENGTKLAGGFHLGFWNEDTLRTTTFIGVPDINTNFYLRDQGISMNLQGYMAYQEIMMRLGKSDFFLGGNYVYADIQSRHNNEDPPVLKPVYTGEYNMGGLAAILQYDTRDSIFTPSEGIYTKATLRRFDDAFGGNENFWQSELKTFAFYPLGQSFTLGIRVEGEAVHASNNDHVPFFANPFIDMRGIPVMRYQGEKMVLAEAELRWEFIPRWNLVLFGGGGKVFGDIMAFDPQIGSVQQNISFSDAQLHSALGVGFRYELARKYGLWGGLDFATSEEEKTALYITVGSAWSGF